MATTTTYDLHCTNCQQALQITIQFAGQLLVCPHCNAHVVSPTLESAGTSFASNPQTPTPQLESARFFTPVQEPSKSDDEKRQEAKRAAKSQAENQKSGRCTKPQDRSAGRLVRFCAFVIDIIGAGASLLLGFFPLLALAFSSQVHRSDVIRYAEFVCGDVVIAMATREYAALFRAAQSQSFEFWTVALACNSVLILYLLWQVYSVSAKGQTFGKRIMKIRVVDGLGFMPGFGRAFLLRSLPVWSMGYFAYYIAGPVVAGGLWFLMALNFMMIVLNPPRCFHDRLAGTYVIDV